MFRRLVGWFRGRQLARRLRDLDEITFEIETTTTTERVTVPLDFSDFSSFEVERVGVLTKGADDPAVVACAFLFVAAARQVELTDEDYAPFRESIALMFEGDASMVKVG